jgi:hypothetical protein
MNRRNVGVVDLSRCARFVQNPRMLLVFLPRREEALQRHLPVEPWVPAQIHFSHTPDAEAIEEDIRADARSGSQFHRHLSGRGGRTCRVPQTCGGASNEAVDYAPAHENASVDGYSYHRVGAGTPGFNRKTKNDFANPTVSANPFSERLSI